MQIILKCGDCGMESDGFHASVDHMGECHPQYFVGDKQAICIFCLKVSIWCYKNKWYLLYSRQTVYSIVFDIDWVAISLFRHLEERITWRIMYGVTSIKYMKVHYMVQKEEKVSNIDLISYFWRVMGLILSLLSDP